MPKVDAYLLDLINLFFLKAAFNYIKLLFNVYINVFYLITYYVLI